MRRWMRGVVWDGDFGVSSVAKGSVEYLVGLLQGSIRDLA
jgi:hypothetical protein